MRVQKHFSSLSTVCIVLALSSLAWSKPSHIHKPLVTVKQIKTLKKKQTEFKNTYNQRNHQSNHIRKNNSLINNKRTIKPSSLTQKNIPILPIPPIFITQPEPIQQIASLVVSGTFNCFEGKTITLIPRTDYIGYIDVQFNGKSYVFLAVNSNTGAVRLENAASNLFWLQLPIKNMLFNSRTGSRVLDDCQLKNPIPNPVNHITAPNQVLSPVSDSVKETLPASKTEAKVLEILPKKQTGLESNLLESMPTMPSVPNTQSIEKKIENKDTMKDTINLLIKQEPIQLKTPVKLEEKVDNKVLHFTSKETHETHIKETNSSEKINSELIEDKQNKEKNNINDSVNDAIKNLINKDLIHESNSKIRKEI